MNSKIILAAIVIIASVQVSNGYSCGCGSPITLPLPFPSHIPIGQYCSCKPIHLKPTLITPPTCPSDPCCPQPNPCCQQSGLTINPAILKKLLPLLPLLGGAL